MISNTMSSGLSTEFEIIAVLPALEVLLVFFFFLIKPYRLVPKCILFWQGKLSLAVKSHFRELADIYFSPSSSNSAKKNNCLIGPYQFQNFWNLFQRGGGGVRFKYRNREKEGKTINCFLNVALKAEFRLFFMYMRGE